MKLDDLYRDMIIKYAKDESHCGIKGYGVAKTLKNPLCGDATTIEIKIEEGKIASINHITEGCIIIKASAALMAETFCGIDILKAKKIVAEFKRMLDEDLCDEEILGELILFKGIKSYPARKKCALLPYLAAEELIND